ncbi:Zn(2)-C6 fungal-type domain-containing protein [Fusarium sp. Ph1]|nr:Zn(2)-C6 fungal-type domain-containing protein [Fusarium sp. Ph1]
MPGNGSRSRDGCFNCRRRKRRCDEEKPVCRRCRKMGDNCVFPEPASASNPLKFVVAASPDHYIVPVGGSDKGTSFLNLSPRELAIIWTKIQGDQEQESQEVLYMRDIQSLVPFPRVISPYTVGRQYDGQSIESALVQYYVEVISSSRVYVQTGRNGFRTSVIPRVLHNQGPLLSAVLAMSAAEWAHDIVVDGRDYRALSTQYKVRALQELQHTLPDPQSCEGNLLTCVLLASLEIAQGSRPAWLRHLQGALALIDSFGTTIDPSVAQFALQYFRFRYVLMETTKPTGRPQEATDSVDLAMAGLARAEVTLPKLHETRGIIDEQIGCSMDLVDIINEISALSLASGGHDDTVSKDHLYTKGQELEHRINQLSTQDISTDEYLLKSAESFRIATQIYLRLVCYNTPITHPSILEPHEALLSCLSDIISERQARRSFPMWPLFLAGCACSSDEQRKPVLDYFTLLDSKWPISNISAVFQAVRTVWHTRDLISSSNSCTNQDWRDVIHKFGWKLSLS